MLARFLAQNRPLLQNLARDWLAAGAQSLALLDGHAISLDNFGRGMIKILVVDDEPHMLRLVSYILESAVRNLIHDA